MFKYSRAIYLSTVKQCASMEKSEFSVSQLVVLLHHAVHASAVAVLLGDLNCANDASNDSIAYNVSVTLHGKDVAPFQKLVNNTSGS